MQDQGTRLLRLRIIAGHNLAKKDIFGASDPYVKIDVIRDEDEAVIDSVYTKTKKRTLNPKWDEEFIFRVKPGFHHLCMEVFDENRLTRDDFLGSVELPLQNIPRERPDHPVSDKHYILRPRTSKSKVKGHLQVYHAYLPSESDDESPPESEQVSVLSLPCTSFLTVCILLLHADSLIRDGKLWNIRQTRQTRPSATQSCPSGGRRDRMRMAEHTLLITSPA
jgi:hypothetical protein